MPVFLQNLITIFAKRLRTRQKILITSGEMNKVTELRRQIFWRIPTSGRNFRIVRNCFLISQSFPCMPEPQYNNSLVILFLLATAIIAAVLLQLVKVLPLKSIGNPHGQRDSRPVQPGRTLQDL